MNLSRRRLLFCAPAIVAASSLMKLNPWLGVDLPRCVALMRHGSELLATAEWGQSVTAGPWLGTVRKQRKITGILRSNFDGLAASTRLFMPHPDSLRVVSGIEAAKLGIVFPKYTGEPLPSDPHSLHETIEATDFHLAGTPFDPASAPLADDALSFDTEVPTPNFPLARTSPHRATENIDMMLGTPRA